MNEDPTLKLTNITSSKRSIGSVRIPKMGVSSDLHVEEKARDVRSGSIKGARSSTALEATELEHQMSFIDAVKMYPGAVGWSIFFSLGIIMTAFDPQLLGSMYAVPSFQKKFGYQFGDGYIISAPWQTGLGMGNPIGQCVGALGAAYPMEWWGRKKVCFVTLDRGYASEN